MVSTVCGSAKRLKSLCLCQKFLLDSLYVRKGRKKDIFAHEARNEFSPPMCVAPPDYPIPQRDSNCYWNYAAARCNLTEYCEYATGGCYLRERWNMQSDDTTDSGTAAACLFFVLLTLLSSRVCSCAAHGLKGCHQESRNEFKRVSNDKSCDVGVLAYHICIKQVSRGQRSLVCVS